MIEAPRGLRPTIAAALLALSACGPATPAEGLPEGTLLIEARGGEVRADVSIAETPEARSRGLMGVERMDPDVGMVFLQAEPARIHFWMKDTLIPLSIAFWGPDRRIATILDMELCRTNPCPTYDPEVDWVGALEVNQGFFEEQGVEVRDAVRLER